jgi:hypothetical protein
LELFVPLSENQIALLNALGAHEEAIAKLYAAYSAKFTSFNDFWDSLYSDKIKHAQWINLLASDPAEQSIFIKENKFNLVAIKNFHDYIETETNRANTRSVTLVEALSTTLSIEQSLIERRLFEIFDSDSAEFKQLISTIDQENKLLSRKAEDALERYKTLRY